MIFTEGRMRSFRHPVWAMGLALITALMLQPTPALAGICHYENLMPEFFAFRARTRDLAPEARAEKFMTEIAARHPEFYGDKDDFRSPEALRKASLRLLDPAHPEALPGFAPLTEERLRAGADTVESDFATGQEKFLKAFPDFRCEDDIAFGPSFLHFDGHEYKDERGQGHMLFGVDAIAALHGPEDMPAFYAHELFHIYHRQLMGAAMPSDDLAWWEMWEEGLATYVSQRLNSGLDAQHVLWFPKDMVRQMQAPGVTARAAKLLLADFDKTGDTHWFVSGQGPAAGLPPRAGYYMGYLLARELGKNHPLAWLAHLPPDQVKAHAHAFLEAQAG